MSHENDLITRLKGRDEFLRDRGEVKSPELLEQAAAALQSKPEQVAVPEGIKPTNLADRLDGLADLYPAGSQEHSDLLAAATVWRKHISHTSSATPPPEQQWKEVSCTHCDGSGKVEVYEGPDPATRAIAVDCQHCGGNGYTIEPEVKPTEQAQGDANPIIFRLTQEEIDRERRRFQTTYEARDLTINDLGNYSDSLVDEAWNWNLVVAGLLKRGLESQQPAAAVGGAVPQDVPQYVIDQFGKVNFSNADALATCQNLWNVVISYLDQEGITSPQAQAGVGELVKEKHLSQHDEDSLVSFYEQCQDSDADGYTVPKEDMKRLAEIGCVNNRGFGRYEVTSFGEYIVKYLFLQNPTLPLETTDDFNARQKALASARVGA